MKLNLGCGQIHLKGFLNVDKYPPADALVDLLDPKIAFSKVEEVRMIHSLEHFSWLHTDALLQRIASWMVPDARIIIEVPDMAVICANMDDPWFNCYVYGCHAHPGEFHFAGFTAKTLVPKMTTAGFKNLVVREFLSPEPQRPKMPCLEIIGEKA